MDDRHLMERLWALRKAVDRFTLSPAQMSVGVEAWLADTDFTEDPRVRRLVHLLRQCDAQRATEGNVPRALHEVRLELDHLIGRASVP